MEKRILTKTLMYGFLLLGMFLSAGCGSKDSGTTTTTVSAVTTGYYILNGNCYAYPSGTVVATTYCSLSGTTTATTSTITTTTCIGYYTYVASTGQSTTGYCNGSNCSGYTLYNSSGQQVKCL